MSLTLVIAGQPAWAAAVQQALSPQDTLLTFASAEAPVARLAQAHPALVLVDGDALDGPTWTGAAKTSPATRRIPLVVVSASPAARQAALRGGADLALAPEELPGQMSTLLKDFARSHDPADAEQLDCECREALPPLAQAGVAKFNAGEYYPQHDLFEEQWMATAGPVRDLYRAILQVGVAYYQIERGNYRGAMKMLLRSVQWLVILPEVCQGVNVRQLREDSYRVRAELERLGPAGLASFDRALLRPVLLVTSDV